MYDRKTWMVVVLCSVVLALNLYYTQKNAPVRAKQLEEQRRVEQAGKELQKSQAEGEAPGVLAVEPPNPAAPEEIFTIESSEVVYELTTFGGGVKRATFKNAAAGATGEVEANYRGANPIGALAEGVDQIESSAYTLVKEESVPGKKVVFAGKLASGLEVKKVWSLEEGEGQGAPYLLKYWVGLKNPLNQGVDLERYSVTAGTASPVALKERKEQTGFAYLEQGDEFEFVSVNQFAGGWFSKEKTTIAKDAKEVAYMGVTSQFYATVVKPASAVGEGSVWGKVGTVDLVSGASAVKSVQGGMTLPKVHLPAGQEMGFDYQVFIGPKENRMLRKMGEDWGELMNYGFFSPFSRFMNWGLFWVHEATRKVSEKWSWGLAVIVLTILLRVAIWPLYHRSNRIMKRMSKLKPEMDRLREKYPDDPTKMNQEMMKLYRTYGVNPLGGCLPMFAQLPIFIGFYSMLQHAVEMRGSGIFWVPDLSLPDTVTHLAGIPINPLPILMALTSVVQMMMMPNTGGDKTQMAIMKLMPLIFLYICYDFASALALYWTTSNLFSIGQTWLTNRLPEPELVAVKSSGKKSWVERMAEKQEEMQRMKQANGRVVDPREGDKEPKKRRPRTGG